MSSFFILGNASSSVANRDYLNDRINMNVAGEIMKGKIVQEKKPQYYTRIKQSSLLPIVIKELKPRPHSQHNKRVHPKNNISCCCSCRPLYRSDFQDPTTHERNLSNPKKCTMRTAELAVPTKRHCLDTWRNKSYLLPPYKVESLKQYVMDMHPLVNISEAKRCFQKRKTRLTKKHLQPAFNINVSKFHKPLRSQDTKSLCIIFANRIMLGLCKQMNLKLSDSLEKIYRVVSNDVSEITNRGSKNYNLRKYKRIHTEVSNKITIWLNDILDDSSYKLLEDDLKDLEEEEGPVLDFLDDLIDNVLTLCVSEPVLGDDDKISDSTKTIEHDNQEQMVESKVILPINEHCRNIIHNIIRDMFKNLQDSENKSDIRDNTSDTQNDNITKTQYFQNGTDHNHINSQAIKDQLVTGNDVRDDAQYFKNDQINVIRPETQNQERDLSGDGQYLNNDQLNNIFQDTQNQSGSLSDISDNNVIQEIQNVTNHNLSDDAQPSNNNKFNNITQATENQSITGNYLHDDGHDLKDDVLNNTLQQTHNHIATGNDLSEDVQLSKNNQLNNIIQETQNLTRTESDSHDTQYIKNVLVQNMQNNSESKNNLRDDVDDNQASHTIHAVNSNHDLKPSDVSKIADDENKNVMFSNPHMADYNQRTVSCAENIREQNQRNSEFFPTKRNIYFAEPNRNLLSDADELWPGDIPSNVLRPSTSVTQSILSLGKLFELDEKQLTLSQTDNNISDPASLRHKKETQSETVLANVNAVNISQNHDDLLPIESVGIKIPATKSQEGKNIVPNIPTVKTIQNVEIPLNNDILSTPEQFKPPQSLSNKYIINIGELPHTKETNDESLRAKIHLVEKNKIDNLGVQNTNTVKYIAQPTNILTSYDNVKISNSKEPKIDDNILNSEKPIKYTLSPTTTMKNDVKLPKNEFMFTSNQLTQTLSSKGMIKVDQKEYNKEISEESLITKIDLVEKNKIGELEIQSNITIKYNVSPINNSVSYGDENISYSRNIVDIVNNLLNSRTQDEKVTESIASLINIMQIDQNQLSTTEKRGLQNRNTQTIYYASLPLYDACGAERHRDQAEVEKPKVIVKQTTSTITSVQRKILNEKSVDKVPDCKVQMDCAPSWVRCIKTDGELREKSTIIRAKAIMLPQCVLNKWCKDLDSGFRNLEVWKLWLVNTCKETEYFIRKKNECQCYNVKYWKNYSQLKNKITKDTVLWRDLYQHTHQTFGGFQIYYDRNKVD